MFVDVIDGAGNRVEVDRAGIVRECWFFAVSAEISLAAPRLMVAFFTANEAALGVPERGLAVLTRLIRVCVVYTAISCSVRLARICISVTINFGEVNGVARTGVH